MRKRIVWICDWLLNSNGEPLTGYGNISDYYCRELIRDTNIIALGFSYQRNQHNYLFSLTQTPMHLLGVAIQSINQSYPVDRIILCADITIQRQFIKVPKNKSKLVSIFAVESSPVTAQWAMDLAQSDYLLPISQFGKEESQKAGLNAEHLTIPLDRDIWHPRTLEEKNNIKETLGVKDKTVLFVNAAGNERKNLATILEALRDLKDENFYLYMLTNVTSDISWDLRELVNRFDLNKNVTLFNKGLPVEQLRRLYAGSDFLVNISKAEGLCMPILEAMSVGLPVIATNVTAMKEHLANNCGIGIEPDFKLIDVFGNTDRFYVVSKTLENCLRENARALKANPNYFDTMTENAQKYIDDRNNSNSVDLLRKIINE